MAKLVEDNIDLSTIVSGTGEFFNIASTEFGSLCSVQISQDTVNNPGVNVKLVQTNSQTLGYPDVREDEDDPESTVEVTTTSTSEGIFLASDFVEFDQFGIFVDVAPGTTGELVVTYNTKPSFI